MIKTCVQTQFVKSSAGCPAVQTSIYCPWVCAAATPAGNCRDALVVKLLFYLAEVQAAVLARTVNLVATLTLSRAMQIVDISRKQVRLAGPASVCAWVE